MSSRWDNVVGGMPVSGRERAFRMWLTLQIDRETMMSFVEGGLGNQFDCSAEDVAAMPWDGAGKRVKTRWNGPRVEMDGGDDTPDLALFSPSLESLLAVKTLGCRCIATHDFETDHHERRHFIDRSFVASLPEGGSLLSSLVPPVPRCVGLTIVSPDSCVSSADGDSARPENVVGMLRDPLRVCLRVSDQGEADRKLNLNLCNTLVVDVLPVPLHISVKALFDAARAAPTSALLEAACRNPPPHLRDCCASLFPEEYRQHSYWRQQQIQPTAGNFRPEVTPKTWQAALERAGGNDSVEVRACAACGEETGRRLKRCAGCGKVWYCSADCQRTHWSAPGGHRQVCRASAAAAAAAAAAPAAPAPPPPAGGAAVARRPIAS